MYLFEYKDEFGGGVTSVRYIVDDKENILYSNMNDGSWIKCSGKLDLVDTNIMFERTLKKKEIKEKFFIDNI